MCPRALKPGKSHKNLIPDMHIHDLATHPSPYVSIGELADYWMVSRRYLYKQVRAGALDAIQIGPRSCRIPKTAALDFEQKPKVLDTLEFAAES